MFLTAFLAIALQGDNPRWQIPQRFMEAHDVVDRIIDQEMGNVCYIVRESSDRGIGISCLPINGKVSSKGN